MGAGFTYHCTDCSYRIEVNTGFHYIRDDSGQKITYDPENYSEIQGILRECSGWREDMSYGERSAFKKERSGFSHEYFCKSCHHIWRRDPETDPPECPDCNTDDILKKWDLRDHSCPGCKTGTLTGSLEPDWIS